MQNTASLFCFLCKWFYTRTPQQISRCVGTNLNLKGKSKAAPIRLRVAQRNQVRDIKAKYFAAYLTLPPFNKVFPQASSTTSLKSKEEGISNI